MSTNNILEIAKQKAAGLGKGQMIRLTAESESYWVMRWDNGTVYIGYLLSDSTMPNFNDNEIFEQKNSKGDVFAVWQKF